MDGCIIFWLSEEACCDGVFLAGRGGACLGGLQLPPPAVWFFIWSIMMMIVIMMMVWTRLAAEVNHFSMYYRIAGANPSLDLDPHYYLFPLVAVARIRSSTVVIF